MKLPREVLELILSRPRTWLKSSFAVGAVVVERGRSSLATSVARAMNVERGSVMPRVVCRRFWTSRTALKEIETAISVSGSGAGAAALGSDGMVLLGGGSIDFGGAILMLLRSRWARWVIRADWSEE